MPSWIGVSLWAVQMPDSRLTRLLVHPKCTIGITVTPLLPLKRRVRSLRTFLSHMRTSLQPISVYFQRVVATINCLTSRAARRSSWSERRWNTSSIQFGVSFAQYRSSWQGNKPLIYITLRRGFWCENHSMSLVYMGCWRLIHRHTSKQFFIRFWKIYSNLENI